MASCQEIPSVTELTVLEGRAWKALIIKTFMVKANIVLYLVKCNRGIHWSVLLKALAADREKWRKKVFD